MKRARHLLWLQRPDGTAVVGNAVRLSIAYLDKPELVAEVRNFVENGVEPAALADDTRELLQGCKAILGDLDWEPQSPLDMNPVSYSIPHGVIHLPARIAKRHVVLQQAVSSIARRLENNGVLEVVIWSPNPTKDIAEIKEIAAPLRRFAASLRKQLFLDIWIHTPANTTLKSVMPWAQRSEVGLKINLRLPNGDNPTPEDERIDGNLRLMVAKDIPVCLQAKITQRNLDKMIPAARHFSDLTNGYGGINFAPVEPFNRDGSPNPPELLPDIDKYALNLVAIYEMQLVADDMFYPVNQLRRRLARGVCSPQCGCSETNMASIDTEGKIYACDGLRRIRSFAQDNAVSETNYQMPQRCEMCQWKFFCGLPCLAMIQFLEANAPQEVGRYASDAFCIPRKRLLETLIGDIVDESVQASSQRSP